MATHVMPFYGYLSPLSNFHYATFEVDGVTYHSSEQYYMCMKALYFGDTDTAQQIMSTKSCYQQKQLGMKVKGYDRKKWEEECENIMYAAVYNKFAQNPRRRRHLLLTKDSTLVEASTFDTFWGAGKSVEDIQESQKWEGQNKLGEILMQVRSELDK